MNCNVVQRKGPVHWPVSAPWADCASATCPLKLFWLQVLQVYKKVISLYAALCEEERGHGERRFHI